MPLEDADLDAAAAQGIVTAEQAAALRTFAAQREKERAAQLGHEERFRFMRGFNDFFFAIGVLLLGFGLAFFSSTNGRAFWLAGNIIAAGVIWVLAELLVRRMRLVLPGILLACFFVVFVFRAIPIDLLIAGPPPVADPRAPSNWVEFLLGTRHVAPVTVVAKALVATIAALLYYARFRLPFALLPIAAGLVLAAMAAAGIWTGGPVSQLMLLVCGLAVFGAAMAFDISDRERLTRRADCAFWLHLLAAPLIVHSLVSLVTPNIFRMTNEVAIVVILLVMGLAVVAIVIDRRALLVSALIYVGAVISYALSSSSGGSTANRPFVFFATILILGAFVIALGVGWLPLRQRLLRRLPTRLTTRLPPAAAAAR
jgi:hypothetical protein